LRTNGVELLNNASRPVPHAGESDVVVVLDPWEPSDPFAADVATGTDVHLVGDCRDARFLDGAMLDAARVGRAL
ncbi:MAG: hypothetical protein JWL83_3276, partial [Actinomycetia bacterium]|nr:hypothetical protein [Actinomycetes bacterium]